MFPSLDEIKNFKDVLREFDRISKHGAKREMQGVDFDLMKLLRSKKKMTIHQAKKTRKFFLYLLRLAQISRRMLLMYMQVEKEKAKLDK
jgi:hypothetical protein